VRQVHDTAHVLIGFLGVDTQPDVDLDRLVEFRVGVLLDDPGGFDRVVLFIAVEPRRERA